MKFLTVRNFEQYQHYTDRRPPWIKLHASVLDDYAFTCLQDASKAHLMLLWVLASKLNNRIPFDLPWVTRQIQATSPVDLEELIASGFIEVYDDASALLAPRKQSAMPEGEAETEAEHPSSSPAQIIAEFIALVPEVRQQFWLDEIKGWRSGVGLPRSASPAEVAAALRDYIALAPHERSLKPMHVRGFVRAAQRASQQASNGNGGRRPRPGTATAVLSEITGSLGGDR